MKRPGSRVLGAAHVTDYSPPTETYSCPFYRLLGSHLPLESSSRSGKRSNVSFMFYRNHFAGVEVRKLSKFYFSHMLA